MKKLWMGGGRKVKAFTINIKETLEKQVKVEAESFEDAIQLVEAAWKSEEYVLDAKNFTGVEFTEEGVE